MKASAKPISWQAKTTACSCLQIKPTTPLRRGGPGLGLALLLALATAVSAQWVTVDSTFPAGSGPSAWVRSLAVQADGQTLIGGTFTNVSGSAHPYFARVGTNGAVDAGFFAQVSAEPTRIQPLLDGRILISGSFSNVNGVACPGLARLQVDGTLDSSFVPPSGLSASGSVAVVAASNGMVWVTGTFTSLGGVPRNSVARLLPDGAVDPSFQSPFAATNTVALVALQADGKPLISGTFTNLPGALVTNLVRLNLDGSVDASFVARLAPGERVIRGLLMPDGRLVAAVAVYADFGMATATPHLVRLNLDGSLDPTFSVTFEAPGFPWSSTVYALALQPDGRILVSGTFLRVNGVSRGKIARLAPDGTLDFCFDVAMGGEGGGGRLVQRFTGPISPLLAPAAAASRLCSGRYRGGCACGAVPRGCAARHYPGRALRRGGPGTKLRFHHARRLSPRRGGLRGDERYGAIRSR